MVESRMPMKGGRIALMLFGSLCAITAKGEVLSDKPADQVHWQQLLLDVARRPDADLSRPVENDSSALHGQRLYAAEAECSANAVALLNINDLLTSDATTVEVRAESAWDGKTAIALRRGYANGQHFLFVCLVGKDGNLERTRLLRPKVAGKSSAIEVDASRYLYQGN
jgi:hypothetical protein